MPAEKCRYANSLTVPMCLPWMNLSLLIVLALVPGRSLVMTSIKGQLTFVLPQEEVNYIVIGNSGLYMFPRKDGILLGGTFERNEWSLTPDPVETRRILDGHRGFFEKMDDPWA